MEGENLDANREEMWEGCEMRCEANLQTNYVSFRYRDNDPLVLMRGHFLSQLLSQHDVADLLIPCASLNLDRTAVLSYFTDSDNRRVKKHYRLHNQFSSLLAE